MISFAHNIDAFERGLSDMAKRQLPFAIKSALNDSAADALDAVKVEIERSFDRPTRWTRNAFFIRYARKNKLAATVERKTVVRGRHYLEVQSTGGPRKRTALESLLSSRLKYAGDIRAITPAKGARLNSFGNWSPGQRNQVLSAVKSQRDATANATKRSVGRNKGRAGYFVPRPGSKLRPGVYRRKGKRGVVKVINLIDVSPRYSKRFRFSGRAQKAGHEMFEQHFIRRLKDALATAK